MTKKAKPTNAKKTRVGSQAALARERKITEASVSIAVRNGTLNPAIVTSKMGRRQIDLDKANEIMDSLVKTKKRQTMAISDATERKIVVEDDTDAPEDEIPAQVVSRAKREHYQAKLARIEYEQKAGRLVDAETVAKEAFELARTVRDAILAIPDRLAAILAAERTERRTHDLLTKELIQALSDLQKRAT